MYRVEATHLAAGVAYYTLMSLFPLILGLLAILGIVLTPEETQQEFLDFVTINLPGSRVFAEENVSRVGGPPRSIGNWGFPRHPMDCDSQLRSRGQSR